MKYRKLGKTGINVSEISLGTWQLGGKWGSAYDDKNAEQILNAAIDNGINFFDTADVYSDGLSEKSIGKVLKSRSERIYVATKCGRFLNPHISELYQPLKLRKFVENSLENLQLECLDLIQLHCPPTEVFYRPEIFELFDALKLEGKILHFGVSVEKVEESLKAIEYENVETVQIIFNMFRHRPSELFFQEAIKKNIGVLARVPLASGLLTGKFTANSIFSESDHRNFNINGDFFDKGETFSGIDFETGLKAVGELKSLFETENLSNIALKWILMFEAVSCVIPGASTPAHLISNLQTSNVLEISNEKMDAVKDIYEKYIKRTVHHKW